MTATPAKRRLVIIGSGPCGLGAGYRAEEIIAQGDTTMDWTIVEAAPATGGLAASMVDDAGFIWDKGGHVIFSHYAYFSRLLDELIPPEGWNQLEREAWVWMRQRFIPYPFQQNLHRLPEDEQVACVDGLVANDRARHTHPKPAHFKEWLLQSFGLGLCNTFMFPYNFKVWAYTPDKMNVEWMGERVATVDTAKVVKNIILKKDEVGWGQSPCIASKLRFILLYCQSRCMLNESRSIHIDLISCTRWQDRTPPSASHCTAVRARFGKSCTKCCRRRKSSSTRRLSRSRPSRRSCISRTERRWITTTSSRPCPWISCSDASSRHH